jgi:hypothetical protein
LKSSVRNTTKVAPKLPLKEIASLTTVKAALAAFFVAGFQMVT